MHIKSLSTALLTCAALSASPVSATIDRTSVLHGWERPEICLPADTTYLREEVARLLEDVVANHYPKPSWRNDAWQRPVAELPNLLDLLGLYEDAQQMRDELAATSRTCMAMH